MARLNGAIFATVFQVSLVMCYVCLGPDLRGGRRARKSTALQDPATVIHIVTQFAAQLRALGFGTRRLAPVA
jgi:hypothetical protein